ncbi:HIT family protein [Acrocarpospora macrocephala]|uniref:HIT family protein n=1 Tax=Acrocarpospora macrocephala TaxID=150177 RepID=A0A5M3WRE0_9ACTN|nr:HIT family protein [Acrocarpospora macrocephala]GES11066.1 HIT family protein [Acrocarpospora macrocephala]
MTDCLFCAIANGDKPGYIVFRDDSVAAFLDTRPVFKGHVLVVPRQHVETLTDLPGDLVGPFFLRVQTLTGAVETGVEARGSFVAMNNRISQSVPHLHVHIVPRNPKDGLRGFFWPRMKYADDAEIESYAERIRACLAPVTF